MIFSKPSFILSWVLLIIQIDKIFSEDLFRVPGVSQTRQLDGSDINFLNYFSMQYQGCSKVKQWSDYSDSYQKVYSNSMVNFRLCPENSCNSGCSHGYGEYVIDMDTYVSKYIVDKQFRSSDLCLGAAQECGCNSDDDQNCFSDCFINSGLDSCLANGGYENVYGYSSCTKFQNQNNRKRNLDEENANDAGQGETSYYIGPYCADNGFDIFIGIFTDQYCSIKSSETIDSLTNGEMYLPFSSVPVASSECTACYIDSSTYSYLCNGLYSSSGKCESKMSITGQNSKECSFVHSVLNKSGSTPIRKRNTVVSILISFMCVIAMFLFAYILYVRNVNTHKSRY